MTFDQIIIAVFGTLSALALFYGWTRTSLVLALCAQPAWLVTALQHRQWGVVYICLVYTIIWSLLLWRARKG